MKFIAIALLLVLFNFSYSKGCDKNNSCQVCQKVIYQLKFKYQTRCNFLVHCKTTCTKVLQEWSKPGSTFGPFQNDSVGKCDACFRAGFCSATHCQEQKRKEEIVIQRVINGQELKGKKHSPVNGREMDNMVKKIIEGKKVEFHKITNKVRHQIKKAIEPKNFPSHRNDISSSLQKAIDYGLAKIPAHK